MQRDITQARAKGKGRQRKASADPARRAVWAIQAVVRAVRIAERTIEAESGISAAQLEVLEQLEREPAESVTELGQRMFTHTSSASAVVRRLVARGLVSREIHPHDHRRTRIAITASGRQILGTANPTVWKRLDHGLDTLSYGAYAALGRLLQKWLTAAEINAGPLARPVRHHDPSRSISNAPTDNSKL